MNPPSSVEEFARQLRVRFELAETPDPFDTFDDLGLDSLARLELLALLEDLGARVPDYALEHISSVMDAFHWLSTAEGRQGEARR